MHNPTLGKDKATVLLVVLTFSVMMAGYAAAAPEICNYLDDDGDTLIDEDFRYQGLTIGSTCDGVGECGYGMVYCVNDYEAGCTSNPGGSDYDGSSETCDYADNDCDGSTDEGFTYQGLTIGSTCDGVGECGYGMVYCSSTSTAGCSSNPGGSDYDGSTEVCDGGDDDCDGSIDEGGSALCDNGAWCDGSESCGGVTGCQAGTAPDCADAVACTADSCNEATDSCGHAANDAYCNDGAWCNGAETCNVASGCQSGTPVSCTANNLPSIATCGNVPDSNPFTWDFFAGFTSACSEATDSCTTGTVTVTSTCSVGSCGAQCDATHACASYCSADVYYSSGTCTTGCTCSYSSQDCNALDGWVDNGSISWVSTGECTQKQQKGQNYMDYTCGGSGCAYTVTSTRWIDTGVTGNKADGTTCNDGQYCTVSDVCSAGVCGGPSARDCSDGISCTADSCSEATDSCVHTANDAVCDNGAWCDGAETCNVATGCQAGTAVSCSGNNIGAIAACFYNPDGNPFTWDYFAGFTSTCNEATDSCTVGSVTLTHTCNVATCGAQCDATHACAPGTCSETFNDYCSLKKLVEYDADGVMDSTAVSNSCENSCDTSCGCSDCVASCAAPATREMCVFGACGAEWSETHPCPASQHNVTGCSCILDGDVNLDNRVNIQDLAIVAKAFGTKPGDARWNPVADIAANTLNVRSGSDGLVNFADLMLVGKNYGHVKS